MATTKLYFCLNATASFLSERGLVHISVFSAGEKPRASSSNKILSSVRNSADEASMNPLHYHVALNTIALHCSHYCGTRGPFSPSENSVSSILLSFRHSPYIKSVFIYIYIFLKYILRAFSKRCL